MTGRIVDAKAELVVDRDKLFNYIKANAKEVTLETLADAIHESFCGNQPGFRDLSGLQAEIHRRQHVEIARAIYDKLPG